MNRHRRITARHYPLIFILLFWAAFSPAGHVSAEKNPAPYDRVIIIAVDGAGASLQEGSTPNFDRIFADGCVTYDARATVPTMSAPGWGAVFCGVPGKTNGMDNLTAQRYHQNNALYPSIFKLTKDAWPQSEVASFAAWYAINWGLIERDSGVYLYPDDQKLRTKEDIVDHLFSYLDNHTPRLLFVYFHELDEALHTYGYQSPEYMQALTEIDTQMGALYDELKRRGLLDNSLVLFTTDHGGKGRGHGGGSDQETRCTFAATGPGVEAGGKIGEMELQDVAAIVLYALGIEQPEMMTGRVPAGIFPGTGGEERKQLPFQGLLAEYGSPTPPEPEEERSLPPSLEGKLAYYQDFEGKVKLSGDKTLSPTAFGQSLNMRNSYLNTGVKDSAKWPGLTIGFWFCDYGEEKGDPVFLADKNWTKGYYKGFAIVKNGDRLQINIGGGKKHRKDIIWRLPDGYEGKWIHCLAVFDQSTQEVSLYFDFIFAGKASLLTARRSGWISGLQIVAGQDTTAKYPYRMNAEMDEIMIFRDALSEEEISEIRDYYVRNRFRDEDSGIHE